jgi:hypothetical protein
MIYLDFAIEQPLFESIIRNPQAILSLPEETYNRFFKFMIQEEMYEDISKLESVKDRLTTKTLDEYIEDVIDGDGWVEL